MAHIKFVDQTLRDGQQSLWGMKMQAGMILPVADQIDRVGYSTVDYTGSSMFEVLIKYLREDPWAGVKEVTKAMPRSRLRAGMRSNAAVTFSLTPDALMDTWVRQLCEHGIRSFWIYDVLFNIDKMKRLAKVAKEYDAEVALAIMFTNSPVHTDEYYAKQAGLLAESPHCDTLLVYDTAGVLLPERVRTLVPAIQAQARGKALEIHSHNITGLTPLSYLEAVKLGVEILHTASHPLANGASMPSIQQMLKNIQHLGHTSDIDESLLYPIESHFTKVAKAAGYAIGVPNEFDLAMYDHQVPGGMMGTFKNQLAMHKMPERLGEVLKETAIVRRELGYPGMATPFSQLVGTTAVLNVVTGKRWTIIPDEVILYAYGHYGQPAGPIDPKIMDMIMSSPRAKELRSYTPPQPSQEDLRKQYGTNDDAEVLLKALVPEPDIAAMRAAGPLRRDYPLLSSPELAEVDALLRASSKARQIHVATEAFSLTLRKA